MVWYKKSLSLSLSLYIYIYMTAGSPERRDEEHFRAVTICFATSSVFSCAPSETYAEWSPFKIYWLIVLLDGQNLLWMMLIFEERDQYDMSCFTFFGNVENFHWLFYL